MDEKKRIDILERQLEDLCGCVLKIQKMLINVQESVITLQELAINHEKVRRSSNGKDQA